MNLGFSFCLKDNMSSRPEWGWNLDIPRFCKLLSQHHNHKVQKLKKITFVLKLLIYFIKISLLWVIAVWFLLLKKWKFRNPVIFRPNPKSKTVLSFWYCSWNASFLVKNTIRFIYELELLCQIYWLLTF